MVAGACSRSRVDGTVLGSEIVQWSDGFWVWFCRGWTHSHKSVDGGLSFCQPPPTCRLSLSRHNLNNSFVFALPPPHSTTTTRFLLPALSLHLLQVSQHTTSPPTPPPTSPQCLSSLTTPTFPLARPAAPAEMATSVLLPFKQYVTLETPPHTCNQRLTNRAGNRLDRQCHAQQHQQGLGARRAPRQSARQDRQPGRFGAGLQTRCQQSQKADVVEGHEDENVPDHRHHHPAGHHHCPQWYVMPKRSVSCQSTS